VARAIGRVLLARVPLPLKQTLCFELVPDLRVPAKRGL
jgi:hypothetical protein